MLCEAARDAETARAEAERGRRDLERNLEQLRSQHRPEEARRAADAGAEVSRLQALLATAASEERRLRDSLRLSQQEAARAKQEAATAKADATHDLRRVALVKDQALA